MQDDLRRRQAYLAAMGITAWYPRFLLPGAPVPLDYGDDEEEAAEGSGTRAEQDLTPGAARVPETTPRRASGPTGTGAVAAEAANVRKPSTPPHAAEPFAREAQRKVSPVATDPELGMEASRFRLVFLACGAGLGVVAQIPHEERGLLGPGRRDLLSALLQARLGLALPPDARELPFQWPLEEGLKAPAGAARAALTGFLARQAEESGCRLLLVLGEHLAPLLLDGREPRRGIPYPLSDRPWRLLFARSLDEVLALPLLKRELWRDLAALGGLTG